MATQQSGKKRPERMDDFFTLFYRTGAIFNQMTEERVQVVPVLQWKKLKDSVTREFPENAPVIMSIIGSSVGSSFAEEMMAKISDPTAFAIYLSEMLAATGWGIFSIVGDTRYGSRLVVSVANCSFCDKEDLADSPQCDLLRAALKGMADTTYGTTHRVLEERCTAMGEPACLFVVESFENPQYSAGCDSLKFCEFDLENERHPHVEQKRSRESRWSPGSEERRGGDFLTG